MGGQKGTGPDLSPFFAQLLIWRDGRDCAGDIQPGLSLPGWIRGTADYGTLWQHGCQLVFRQLRCIKCYLL